MTIGKNTLNNTKQPFPTVEKQKDLGVTVDTKLSFNDHIISSYSQRDKDNKNNLQNFPISRQRYVHAII